MHRALESGRYDFIGGTVENPVINKSAIQIKLVEQSFLTTFVHMNGNKIFNMLSYYCNLVINSKLSYQ